MHLAVDFQGDSDKMGILKKIGKKIVGDEDSAIARTGFELGKRSKRRK